MTAEVMFLYGWNEWILGLTLLENYYAVYDQENGKIGFAVSKTSSMASEVLKDAEIAEQIALLEAQTESESENQMQLLAGMAGSAALLGLFGLICTRKQRLRKQNAELDLYLRAN